MIAVLAATLAMQAQARPGGISADRLTVGDGLSSNIVSCMLQDRDGFVWIATFNGLNVFDGYSVTSYANPSAAGGSPAPIVRMAEDKRHRRLWLYTSNGGVSCFDTSARRYIPTKGSPAELAPKDGTCAATATARFVSDGKGGLTRLGTDGSRKTLRLIPENIIRYTRNDHFHVASLADGREAISTYGAGLYIHDPETGELTQYTAENSGGIIRNNYITSMITDRSGCLWIAEDFLGLAILRFSDLRHTRVMTAKDAATQDDNNVRCISQLSGGELLVGDMAGGLRKLDAATWETTAASHAGHKTYCAYEDSLGRLWRGTRGGGLYVEDRQLTTGNSGLPSMHIYDIAADRNGGIWIATRGGGVARVTQTSDGDFSFATFLTRGAGERNTHDLETDGNGDIWVATESGIRIINPENPDETAVFCSDNGTLPYDYIICLRHDGNGNIWAGTVGGGLLRCRRDGDKMSYKNITTAHGLACNDVNSILTDSFGQIWAGTEYGLSCVDTALNSVSNYLIAGNALGDVYSENASLRLPDGRLLFGTHSGIVAVTPEKIPGGPAPRTHVTRLYAGGSDALGNPDVEWNGKEAEVPYGMSTLTFSFSNFQYRRIRSVLYQYYLEGAEDGWCRPTESNSATYSKLPPGTYRLHVRSNNGGGAWGAETVVAVTVGQPWWNSATAWLAYVTAAVAAAGYAALTLRKIWNLRNRLRIERGVTEMKIDFFTNVTHEFTVPLTLIRAATEQFMTTDYSKITRSTAQTIVSNARRLNAMVNKLMQFRQITRSTLQPHIKNADFIAFTRKICHDFRTQAESRGAHIVIVPFAKQFVTGFDADMTGTIIGNMMSNAVRFSPEKGRIRVTVRKDGDNIAVTVEDEGPGITQEERKRLFTPYSGKNPKSGMGMGLYISRQMAAAHHGSLTFAPAAGGGAAFTLRLPVMTADTGNAEDSGITVTEAAENLQEMMPVPMNGDITAIIVEDDTETLDYLRYRLGQLFRIYASGPAGIMDDIMSVKPAIVVTELSATTDGIGITSKIKAEYGQRVQVIIISSHNDDSHMAKSIKAGADGYVTKPFSMEVLNATCVRCARIAMEWAKTESKPATGTGQQEIVTREQDKRFVETMRHVLNSNIKRPGFSVAEFAAMMRLGRSQFYKRVTELTGMTPAAHIHKARMSYVAELLRDTGMTVDEIREAAGFGNPTHFHNTFRKFFGTSPAQYRKIHKY